MCRFVVTLAGDVPTIEKLRLGLPMPWTLVYGRNNENCEWLAICEAPGTEGALSGELGRVLSSELGDTDFQWWEEKEYITTSAAEKAALDRLKRQLEARQDLLSRVGIALRGS